MKYLAECHVAEEHVLLATLVVGPPVEAVAPALVEDVGGVDAGAEGVAGDGGGGAGGGGGGGGEQAGVQDAKQVGRLAAVPQQATVKRDIRWWHYFRLKTVLCHNNFYAIILTECTYRHCIL